MNICSNIEDQNELVCAPKMIPCKSASCGWWEWLYVRVDLSRQI